MAEKRTETICCQYCIGRLTGPRDRLEQLAREHYKTCPRGPYAIKKPDAPIQSTPTDTKPR